MNKILLEKQKLVDFLLKKKLKDVDNLIFQKRLCAVFDGCKDEDIEKELSKDRKHKALFGGKS